LGILLLRERLWGILPLRESLTERMTWVILPLREWLWGILPLRE